MNKESTSAIVIKDVTLRLGGRVILERLSASIPAGKVTAVLGPSGAGKTTLMRLALGQLRPDSGQVWMGNVRVVPLGARAMGCWLVDICVLLQCAAQFSCLPVIK